MPEQVLYVGVAQEKQRVFRTSKRRNPVTGASYPWLVAASGVVNQYYFYCVDEDFGPFFIKFCSYFPYTAQLCDSGNEFAKRHAARAGIGFEPLDNGFRWCENPARLQAVCDTLGPNDVQAFFDRWVDRLPWPLAHVDRAAGYRQEPHRPRVGTTGAQPRRGGVRDLLRVAHE